MKTSGKNEETGPQNNRNVKSSKDSEDREKKKRASSRLHSWNRSAPSFPNIVSITLTQCKLQKSLIGQGGSHDHPLARERQAASLTILIRLHVAGKDNSPEEKRIVISK